MVLGEKSENVINFSQLKLKNMKYILDHINSEGNTLSANKVVKHYLNLILWKLFITVDFNFYKQKSKYYSYMLQLVLYSINKFYDSIFQDL